MSSITSEQGTNSPKTGNLEGPKNKPVAFTSTVAPTGKTAGQSTDVSPTEMAYYARLNKTMDRLNAESNPGLLTKAFNAVTHRSAHQAISEAEIAELGQPLIEALDKVIKSRDMKKMERGGFVRTLEALAAKVGAGANDREETALVIKSLQNIGFKPTITNTDNLSPKELTQISREAKKWVGEKEKELSDIDLHDLAIAFDALTANAYKDNIVDQNSSWRSLYKTSTIARIYVNFMNGLRENALNGWKDSVREMSPRRQALFTNARLAEISRQPNPPARAEEIVKDLLHPMPQNGLFPNGLDQRGRENLVSTVRANMETSLGENASADRLGQFIREYEAQHFTDDFIRNTQLQRRITKAQKFCEFAQAWRMASFPTAAAASFQAFSLARHLGPTSASGISQIFASIGYFFGPLQAVTPSLIERPLSGISKSGRQGWPQGFAGNFIEFATRAQNYVHFPAWIDSFKGIKNIAESVYQKGSIDAQSRVVVVNHEAPPHEAAAANNAQVEGEDAQALHDVPQHSGSQQQPAQQQPPATSDIAEHRASSSTSSEHAAPFEASRATSGEPLRESIEPAIPGGPSRSRTRLFDQAVRRAANLSAPAGGSPDLRAERHQNLSGGDMELQPSPGFSHETVRLSETALPQSSNAQGTPPASAQQPAQQQPPARSNSAEHLASSSTSPGHTAPAEASSTASGEQLRGSNERVTFPPQSHPTGVGAATMPLENPWLSNEGSPSQKGHQSISREDIELQPMRDSSRRTVEPSGRESPQRSDSRGTPPDVGQNSPSPQPVAGEQGGESRAASELEAANQDPRFNRALSVKGSNTQKQPTKSSIAGSLGFQLVNLAGLASTTASLINAIQGGKSKDAVVTGMQLPSDLLYTAGDVAALDKRNLVLGRGMQTAAAVLESLPAFTKGIFDFKDDKVRAGLGAMGQGAVNWLLSGGLPAIAEAIPGVDEFAIPIMLGSAVGKAMLPNFEKMGEAVAIKRFLTEKQKKEFKHLGQLLNDLADFKYNVAVGIYKGAGVAAGYGNTAYTRSLDKLRSDLTENTDSILGDIMKLNGPGLDRRRREIAGNAAGVSLYGTMIYKTPRGQEYAQVEKDYREALNDAKKIPGVPFKEFESTFNSIVDNLNPGAVFAEENFGYEPPLKKIMAKKIDDAIQAADPKLFKRIKRLALDLHRKDDLHCAAFTIKPDGSMQVEKNITFDHVLAVKRTLGNPDTATFNEIKNMNYVEPQFDVFCKDEAGKVYFQSEVEKLGEIVGEAQKAGGRIDGFRQVERFLGKPAEGTKFTDYTFGGHGRGQPTAGSRDNGYMPDGLNLSHYQKSHDDRKK